MAGTHPDTGQQFVQYEIFGGGAGAASFRDGISGTSINHSNTRIASIEIVETEFPVRAREFRLLADSGGAGRFRGGLGFVREYEILAEEARFSVRAGKHLKPARGVEGGGDGRPGACIVNPGTERERALPSRYADLRLLRGDVVRLETPGGGGFGRLEEREAALIERDLVEGFVTPEGMRRSQGRK
jgi:N-methylhydantoinase B